MEHILILPDDTVIGAEGENVITELTVTRMVNDETELSFGGVCASMLEATVLCHGDKPEIAPGDTLTLYEVMEGEQVQTGLFLCAKAASPTAHTMCITAYDYISKLDKDVAPLLAGAEFPMTLADLTEAVLEECDLQFSGTLPLEDFEVARPAVKEVSGRQLLKWIGQMAGVYFMASPINGRISCGWYGGTPVEVTADDAVLNGLSTEDFETAPVERVQLRSTDADVGTVWPADVTGQCNTYVVEGNPLLAGNDSTRFLPVAEHLYDRLQDMEYCPGKLKLFRECGVTAGDTLYVTDRNGNERKMLAMKVTEKGHLLTVE